MIEDSNNNENGTEAQTDNTDNVKETQQSETVNEITDSKEEKAAVTETENPVVSTEKKENVTPDQKATPRQDTRRTYQPRDRNDRGGRDDRNRRPFQRNPRYRRKFCRFCSNKDLKINYREAQVLEGFITERGKILPRRITGTCAKHQRELSRAIKHARILSLLPFIVK